MQIGIDSARFRFRLCRYFKLLSLFQATLNRLADLQITHTASTKYVQNWWQSLVVNRGTFLWDSNELFLHGKTWRWNAHPSEGKQTTMVEISQMNKCSGSQGDRHEK